MSARFAVGDRVRIADRSPREHNRTPAYVKGHAGTVERLCAPEGQPELLAYGGDGKPAQMVYRVRLDQGEIWPGYSEGRADHLEIEIYEHWLEPA
jgi:nitrile hydratase